MIDATISPQLYNTINEFCMYHGEWQEYELQIKQNCVRTNFSVEMELKSGGESHL